MDICIYLTKCVLLSVCIVYDSLLLCEWETEGREGGTENGGEWVGQRLSTLQESILNISSDLCPNREKGREKEMDRASSECRKKSEKQGREIIEVQVVSITMTLPFCPLTLLRYWSLNTHILSFAALLHYKHTLIGFFKDAIINISMLTMDHMS